jgi:hypothetical protein
LPKEGKLKVVDKGTEHKSDIGNKDFEIGVCSCDATAQSAEVFLEEDLAVSEKPSKA